MLARNEIDLTGSFLYLDGPEEIRAADFGLPITLVQSGSNHAVFSELPPRLFPRVRLLFKPFLL